MNINTDLTDTRTQKSGKGVPGQTVPGVQGSWGGGGGGGGK